MNLHLKTDRLLLRPLGVSDVELCIETRTDPVVMKYIHEPETRKIVVSTLPARCQRGGGGCIGVWHCRSGVR